MRRGRSFDTVVTVAIVTLDPRHIWAVVPVTTARRRLVYASASANVPSSPFFLVEVGGTAEGVVTPTGADGAPTFTRSGRTCYAVRFDAASRDLTKPDGSLPNECEQ